MPPLTLLFEISAHNLLQPLGTARFDQKNSTNKQRPSDATLMPDNRIRSWAMHSSCAMMGSFRHFKDIPRCALTDTTQPVPNIHSINHTTPNKESPGPQSLPEQQRDIEERHHICHSRWAKADFYDEQSLQQSLNNVYRRNGKQVNAQRFRQGTGEM
ncbi:hypothetical protein BDZ45DRAFT_750665 [Acephala macrosclerotiorum]|nr:hypothetical protein BDZ45DRAFT_750665 [Acephala macrosclerotiorum]